MSIRSGKLTVTENDGYYIVDQRMTAKGSYAQFESLHMGHRVYNDASHDHAGFRNAVREEPLFCVGDPAYGEAYFPISVKSGESFRFSVFG